MKFKKSNVRTLDDAHYFSTKYISHLNFFYTGIIIYSASYVLKGHSFLPQKIGDLLQLLGFLSLLIFSVLLIRFKIKNDYLRILFIAFLLWSLGVIIRGINLNPRDLLGNILTANHGILIYFAPLILLIPLSLTFIRKTFDVILILGIIFLACNILFISELLDRSKKTQEVIEFLARTLAIPSGFILLSFKYHNNFRRLIALAVMILAFIFSIYKARRGLSFTLGTLLISSYFIYLINTRKPFLTIYLSALIILLGVLYFTNIYQVNNNKLFSMIAERGDEDTRTGAELYFYNDMQTRDWILGKGINGEYYCPIFQGSLTDYRPLMETGYLQIILKGGLIRLTLFLVIAIPAIFLGLFSSKNTLSKASAIWIFITILSLYPTTIESFYMQYLLVWISIAICYSRELRNISNKQIQNCIQKLNHPSLVENRTHNQFRKEIL